MVLVLQWTGCHNRAVRVPHCSTVIASTLELTRASYSCSLVLIEQLLATAAAFGLGILIEPIACVDAGS